MNIIFLGTASGKPSKDRNVTSIAIILDENEYILIDCGESTQNQILKSELKFNKINSIYITHLHGDHIFGLPGLLSTLNEYRTKKLEIHGPIGIDKFIKNFIQGPYCNINNYEIKIIEYNKIYNKVCTINFKTNKYEIESCFVKHREFCFAYKITKYQTLPKINFQKLSPILDEHSDEILLKGYKPINKIINKLKVDGLIELNNTTLTLKDYVFPTDEKSIIVCLDNNNICKVKEYFKKCDILIHECTYIVDSLIENEINKIHDKAILYGHSTNVMAAKNSNELKSKFLIFTHFSNKYEIKNNKMLNEDYLINETSKYTNAIANCAYDLSKFSFD